MKVMNFYTKETVGAQSYSKFADQKVSIELINQQGDEIIQSVTLPQAMKFAYEKISKDVNQSVNQDMVTANASGFNFAQINPNQPIQLMHQDSTFFSDWQGAVDSTESRIWNIDDGTSVYNISGQAAILSNLGRDIPKIELNSASVGLAKAVQIGIGFEIDYENLIYNSKFKTGELSAKVAGAKNATITKTANLCYYGEVAANIVGLANHPDAAQVASAGWTTAQIAYNELTAALNAFVLRGKTPNKVFMPREKMYVLGGNIAVVTTTGNGEMPAIDKIKLDLAARGLTVEFIAPIELQGKTDIFIIEAGPKTVFVRITAPYRLLGGYDRLWLTEWAAFHYAVPLRIYDGKAITRISGA